MDLDRNRPLQERYRQHETLLSSETQQDSFNARKRATDDPDLVSDLKKWPGLAVQSGLDGSL
jgi:hypothetical protein